MPNAGIHACRSTNWKSAVAGLNRLHSSNVSTNTSTETTRVVPRTSGACCSSRPMNSSSQAPTIGSAMSEVSIGKLMSAVNFGVLRLLCVDSAPQVVPQDQHDAENQRHRISTDRSGLYSAQLLARAGDDAAHEIDRAVDAARVDDLPQPVLRYDADRLHERRVVDLVHVVLVREQPVHARKPGGDRV